MSRRKNKGAWKQAFVQKLTELVFVVGWMEGETLLTDTIRITSAAGKFLTVDALAPFVTPDKECLAFRGMNGKGVGLIFFHPDLNEESRSYVLELINKHYPLEGYTQAKVIGDNVIIDTDELDEIKRQDGGVN